MVFAFQSALFILNPNKYTLLITCLYVELTLLQENVPLDLSAQRDDH